jgi:hypothetical protein
MDPYDMSILQWLSEPVSDPEEVEEMIASDEDEEDHIEETAENSDTEQKLPHHTLLEKTKNEMEENCTCS